MIIRYKVKDKEGKGRMLIETVDNMNMDMKTENIRIV